MTNRFRKRDDVGDTDERTPRAPLREFKDDSLATPPSMLWFRFEVTAYWLLPLTIFCVILFGGIFLVFKLNIFSEGSGDSASLAPYIAPSGDVLVPELLDSYIMAVGGRAALEGIRSVRYKGRLVEASGAIDFQILVSLPDKGMIIVSPGEDRSQKIVLNGDTAWQVSMRGGGERKVTRLNEENTASLAWSLRVHETFRRLAMEKGSDGFSARKIDFQGRSCFELTKIMPDGAEFLAVLDAETLYLLKSSEAVRGAEGMERFDILYDDHRTVSGIVQAYETKTYKDGELYNEAFLEHIEINPGLMSSLFKVPDELTK